MSLETHASFECAERSNVVLDSTLQIKRLVCNRPSSPTVGDETAIPLNDNAPDETDSVWEDLPIIERDASEKKARYYWEHIPSETRHLYNDEFPQAFETQGDVLLVKIPEEMALIEEQIAQAMLQQFPSIRVVCHDEGVEGEFRVRNLRVIKARNDEISTQTQYREHGHTFLIDPAVAYFSTRLGTQRMRTFEAVSSFQEKKERPLVIVDPYAGVGPSMALLYTDANLVSNVYVNDMNPEAIPILKQNMEQFHSRRKHEGTYMIECMDARKIADERPEMIGCADVLLVNLPHDKYCASTVSIPPSFRRYIVGMRLVNTRTIDRYLESITIRTSGKR